MSRIGKQIIVIPDNVEVSLMGQNVIIKGPKGELNLNLHKSLEVIMQEKKIEVKPKDLKNKNIKALWGTYRVLIDNMIVGVTQGFEKKLEIEGTGYKASVSGKKLVMDLGFSHPIELEAPEGIKFEVEKNALITISGIDKSLVGQWASIIRSQRKVEPYKGKGIRYSDEVVRRKEGKKVAGESGGK